MLNERLRAGIRLHYGSGGGMGTLAHRVDHYDIQHATQTLARAGNADDRTRESLVIKLKRLTDSATGIGGNAKEHADLRNGINAHLPTRFRIRQKDILEPNVTRRTRYSKRIKSGNPWG